MDAVPPDQTPTPPAIAASAAIDMPRPQWQVVHCGLARGVLYVTYTERGRAGITPAVATAAVQRACLAAGYPVAGAPGPGARRSAVPISVAAPGSGNAPPGTRPLVRSPPVFTPQALGSSISSDGRNDGDVPWRCNISFSYTADGQPGGARSSSTQATLAPRQVGRVVQLSGVGSNLRFVGVPSFLCNAVE